MIAICESARKLSGVPFWAIEAELVDTALKSSRFLPDYPR